MVAEVLAFALIMMLAVRPMIIYWSRRMQTKSAGTLTLDSLAILLIFIFLSAVTTNLIGIFSIFGAFFLGAVLYDQIELVAAIRRRLNDFVTVFFLPYFSLTQDCALTLDQWLAVSCGQCVAWCCWQLLRVNLAAA